MVIHALLGWGVLTLLCATSPAQANPPDGEVRVSRPAPKAAAPDVFGSVALPVRRSRYSERWGRVAFTTEGALPAFIRAAVSLDGNQQAQSINAAMNRHIVYRFDDLARDHWATAGETNGDRAGDCEDIAIAKMQALRALGVPPSSLYMTIGSDGGAGAVHALLLVNIEGRLWVLDNRVDRLIPHESFGDFYPLLTFSAHRTWLHGYPQGRVPARVAALSLAAANGRLQVGGAGSAGVGASPDLRSAPR